MPRSVSELRSLRSAHVAYILFIEGVDIAFTTDESKELWGTEWIGETFGAHRIVPGLVLSSIDVGDTLDFNTGQIENRITSFQIVDTEGTLPQLFKRAHDSEEILLQTFEAGRGLKPTAWTNRGFGRNVRNKHIGTEAIGPNGERRYLECFPFPISTPGDEHTVDFEDPGRLPRVGVTDTPAIFQGRRVSLYMLYRDQQEGPGSAAWPSWQDQHNAGGLLWKGTMRAKGEIQAHRMWSIQCLGTDSYLSRQLAIRSQTGWVHVAGTIGLTDAENLIAVEPTQTDPAGFVTVYDASAFDTTQRVSGTTPSDVTASVAAIITLVTTGVTANRPANPGGAPPAPWTGSDHRIRVQTGLVSVGTKPLGLGASVQAMLSLVAHVKVWRALGYEPREQGKLFDSDPEDDKGVRFRRSSTTDPPTRSGDLVPGPDYWIGSFSTNRRTRFVKEGSIDNNGKDMLWRGASTVGMMSLSARGSQAGSGGPANVIDLVIGSAAPRIEGQKTVAHSDVDTTGTGGVADSARFFELSGDTVTVEGGELKTKKFRTVARLSWLNSNGHPADGPDGLPRMNVDQYADPRVFGINELPLTSGVVFENGQLRVRPLTAWAPLSDVTHPNRPAYAHDILSQILLTSGTAEGYSGPDNASPKLFAGQNQRGFAAGDSQFGDDLEIADMGVMFPRELVGDAAEFRDAFDHVPGGYLGGLNRVRYVYSGSIDSIELFRSIMEPRRLAWSLRNNVLAPMFIGPFGSDVDFEITEDDMATDVGPETEQNVTTPISGARLAYRSDPEDGAAKEMEFAPAKDRGAYTRTEGEERELTDAGLMPPTWYRESLGGLEGLTGVADWREDFARMWGRDAAEFYSAPHFLITLPINRIKGQDQRIGTRLMVSNPWPVAPTGTYGLAQEPGLVVSTSYNAASEICTAQVLIFATPKPLYFSPFIEILGFDGADAMLAEDPRAFIEPSWSALGGDADVRIVADDRADWELLHSTSVVARVAGQNRLTLASAPTSAFRDKFKYLMMEPSPTQTAAWVNAIYGITTRPDGTHGAGPTDGDRFGDA